VVAFGVACREVSPTAAGELERLGYAVHAGTSSEAGARKARDFIAFNDPTGNRIEPVWRPAKSGARYHSSRDAGITAFSHVGLCTADAARDEAPPISRPMPPAVPNSNVALRDEYRHNPRPPRTPGVS
jgi:2,3-dihydroxy-p-cumate/2,3-dihydroxybenzoate 3,4-dioxygenase